VNASIKVTGLRVRTHVGVSDEERATPQTVVVDLDVDADIASAAASDDIADTIDYANLVGTVSETVAASRSKLLEHLAAQVVSVVLSMDGVRGVTVEIAKDPPPLQHEVDRVSVKIEGSES
jgi:dihydroneopterin aldolase